MAAVAFVFRQYSFDCMNYWGEPSGQQRRRRLRENNAVSVEKMSTNRTTSASTAFHNDLYEFLKLYTEQREKRECRKDHSVFGAHPHVKRGANQHGVGEDDKVSEEKVAEQMNRTLYKLLNEIEQRIANLPNSSDQPSTDDYFDEWAFLTWTLLSVINRIERDIKSGHKFADYGGKHFREKIHTGLVDLVNKAQRMEPPEGVPLNDHAFERFYQAYVTSLISLHDLYTMSQHRWLAPEFEAQIILFKEQLTVCFQYQREFCTAHNFHIWNQLRLNQMKRMTQYGYSNRNFLSTSISYYSHMLYNLGVLAARLHVTMGLCYETKNSKGFTKPDLIKPLLVMVYNMVDMLLSDCILCVEPSQNAIMVTNNLFPVKVSALCRCALFRSFTFQIISEETAVQIHQEIRHRKTFDPPMPIRPYPSAALLAMKPSTGVKRNNATASAEGGNTAHKKSDVNSRESLQVQPSFDPETQCWMAAYPHLLCTTRQKDALLDSRNAAQTGKRPIFYFHVKAEIFGFSGEIQTAHTLSMPFAIATRRNQDCQVQRMMSSYTATCFWLFGTAALDGLLLQWYDNGIKWEHFKQLYAQYFSMNAEVKRTLGDEDFILLQNKMHCSECNERTFMPPGYAFSANNYPSSLISFKNVLCPHLYYSLGKSEVKFSVWRGMLELLHLFSDAKTEVKNMWEYGLLMGFMDRQQVHAMMNSVESGLVMHLSFILSGCVCFSVKSGNQIFDLEPLDLKRLQAKSLHEYLLDIISAEKVEFIMNSTRDWLRVNDAMKICQRSTEIYSQNNPVEREVVSNVTHPDKVDMRESLIFTPLRVAVVTCKSIRPADEICQDIPSLPTYTSEEFEQHLEKLMFRYGKNRMDVINILNRKAVTAAAAVSSPVQPPPISCLPASTTSPSLVSSAVGSGGLQPIYHHSSPLPGDFHRCSTSTATMIAPVNTAISPLTSIAPPPLTAPPILSNTTPPHRRWPQQPNGFDPNGMPSIQQNTLGFWSPTATTAEEKMSLGLLDPNIRFSST